MNLQNLNQSIMRNLEELYPRIAPVFDAIITHNVADGRAVNVRSLITRFNRALKGTNVRVVRELTKKFGSVAENNGQYYPAIGGFCYESPRGTVAKIKIILCIHPSTSRIALTEESWEYFKYRFLKCLSHELVHRAQFENGRRCDNVLVFRPHALPGIPKKTIRNQEYLGDMDEVEAYAHDCVEEWYYLNPTTPLTLRSVKAEFRDHGGRIPSIQYYYETFLGDEHHPSVQRFFRKVKAWNDIIHPISAELPGPPSYVKKNAAVKRDVLMG